MEIIPKLIAQVSWGRTVVCVWLEERICSIQTLFSVTKRLTGFQKQHFRKPAEPIRRTLRKKWESNDWVIQGFQKQSVFFAAAINKQRSPAYYRKPPSRQQLFVQLILQALYFFYLYLLWCRWTVIQICFPVCLINSDIAYNEFRRI